MCPAAITGTSRYTTVGATTLPRPMARCFWARVEPGPYGRIPEAAPFPAAGPMCSAENCRFRQICSFLRQELRNFVQFILKTSCIFPRAMV